MALKQVLDELSFYRKSHFELEHKLNQYITQAGIHNNLAISTRQRFIYLNIMNRFYYLIIISY